MHRLIIALAAVFLITTSTVYAQKVFFRNSENVLSQGKILHSSKEQGDGFVIHYFTVSLYDNIYFCTVSRLQVACSSPKYKPVFNHNKKPQ